MSLMGQTLQVRCTSKTAQCPLRSESDWIAASPRNVAKGQSNSDFTAVICPVQQRLALAWPARRISGFAVTPDLREMPPDCFPTLDLAGVLFWHSTAHIVAAVPVEPASWVIRMYPALATPHRQRLASVDPEVV